MKNEVLFFQGQKVGEINYEDRYYLSYRNRNHCFHIFNDGFGISEKVLDYLYQNKINKIIINFENKLLLSCDIDYFLIKSKEYSDNGDKQLILEGNLWNKEIIKTRQERLVL